MPRIPRELIVKIGANIAGLQRDAGKATATINRIGREAKDAAVTFGVVTTGITGATVALGKMAQAGGRFINVQEAFNARAGDGVAAMGKLQAASRGLSSNYELMVGFNRALALGSAKTAEEFATLVTVSEALGRSLGLEGGAAEAMNKLNLGIGRQSRLLLDDLGIIITATAANQKYAEAIGKTVDQLTDAEKADAFRTEALRQANELVEKSGELSLTAADGYTQLTVAVENLGSSFTSMVANSVEVGGFFATIRNAVEGLDIIFQGMARGVSAEGLGAIWSVESITDIDGAAARLRQENEALQEMRGRPDAFLPPSLQDPRFRTALADQVGLVEALQMKVQALARASGEADAAGGSGDGDKVLGFRRTTLEGVAGASESLLSAITKLRDEIQGAEFERAFVRTEEEATKLDQKLADLRQRYEDLTRAAQAFGGVRTMTVLSGDPFLAGLASKGAEGRKRKIEVQVDFIPGTGMQMFGPSSPGLPGFGRQRGPIQMPTVTPQIERRDGGQNPSFLSDLLGQAGSLLDPKLIASNLFTGLLTGGLSTVLGAVGGFVGGFFGGGDPEQARIQQANTEALERLNNGLARLGDALLGERGGDIGGLRSLLSGLSTDKSGFGGILDIGGQLNAGLLRLGLTMEDLERIAAGLGIEFDGTLSSVAQLRDALETNWLTQITSSFGPGFDLLQQEFELLDIDDPMEQFKRSIEFMASLVREDLAEQLLGLDTENINEFIAGFLDSLRAGTIDLEALGSLSIEDFLSGLGFAESALDKLGETAESTSRILNSPTGFKGAFARFSAADFEIRDPLGGRSGSTDPRVGGTTNTGTGGSWTGGPNTGLRDTTMAAGGVVVHGDVYINANSFEEFEREVVRKHSRGGPVTLRPAYAR